MISVMISKCPRSTRIAAIFAALTICVLGKPAAAQERGGGLTDSLTAAQKKSGGEAGSTVSVGFDAESATLKDYLAYAAIQSPSLMAAFHEWKAARERSGYSGALPNPMLTYTYFIESVETRVGPQNQGFRLEQRFPWYGTRGARKDIAVEAAKVAYQRFEAKRLDLFYEVKSAYYEYYFLGCAIAITRENLELLKFWEAVARAKYTSGLKQHPDVIKAQVELGKLEDELHTLENRIDPLAARLKAAVNLPGGIELPLPADIDVEETIVHKDSVIAAVLANNPDLNLLVHVVEKDRAFKRLAAKASYPDIVVGVGYTEVGEALNPSMKESGKDAWTATVGITLPIWFGANKTRRQEADAQYLKTRYAYADARNRLRAATEEVVFEYENALRKTRLYRDGLVPKAEQSLNASYTAYQVGETDFLNLLDAQRQLLDFQLQLARSRSNLAIRRAELERITGADLSTAGDGG